MSEARFEAVVIGASAGALNALMALLPALPADYPLAILVVVHIPPDRQSVMAELFHVKCQLKTKEAEDKETIMPGTVYFAPPDYHLQVEPGKYISLSSDEPVLFSRPSIDVLFETAADVYGPALIGVILTGANHDGAAGLKMVVDAGGLALVQDPAGAYAAEMPRAALEACPSVEPYSFAQITEALQEAGRI